MLLVQITDRGSVSREETLSRIREGAVVLLRDPQMSGRELLAWGRELRAGTLEIGAGLWVNDRMDVAALVGADGIHLGRRSVDVAEARRFLGERITVSMSAHSLEDVARARDLTADVVMLSPIFASPGKGAPLGLDALRAAASALRGSSTQLIALGGIDLSNARACAEAGADGLAAIRADLSLR